MKKITMLMVLLSVLFLGINLSWADQASQLIVVRASDGSLWKMTCQSGTACTSFTSIPGNFASQPTVIWDTDVQFFYIFGRASDNSIWRASFDANGNFHNNWASIPGATASPIGAAGGGRFLGFDYVQGQQNVSLAYGSVTNIRSGSIVCPYDGYVVASAGGGLSYGGSGTRTTMLYLVTTSAGIDPDIQGWSRALAGEIDNFSFQQIFTCTGGTTLTAYLTGQLTPSTGASVTAYDSSIILEYFPYRN